MRVKARRVFEFQVACSSTMKYTTIFNLLHYVHLTKENIVGWYLRVERGRSIEQFLVVFEWLGRMVNAEYKELHISLVT